jgi:hypothetical protein
VVIGRKPTGDNVGIENINAFELLVGGEVSAGGDSDAVTMGEEEDRGNEANAVLAEKKFDHMSIWIIGDGVLWVWKTEVVVIVVVVGVVAVVVVVFVVMVIVVAVVVVFIVAITVAVTVWGGSMFAIVLRLDEVACQGETITEEEVGDGDTGGVVVPSGHTGDKSGCMEDASGDIEGNRVDGVERVAKEAGDEGPVILSGFDDGRT